MRFRFVATGLAALALAVSACTAIGGANSGSSGSTAPSIIQQHIAWKTDETIKPTAILLHWTAAYNGGPDAIKAFVTGAEGNMSTYNPDLKSTDPHPKVGHVTVQVAVMGNGNAYQLLPELNSFARHAKCANQWAIGIEIEGWNPGHAHYIGNNKKQYETVVKVVRELMAKYKIKAESVVAEDGKSGRGIVSHAQVDKKCKWADGVYAGSGKTDVDQKYLDRVLADVK